MKAETTIYGDYVRILNRAYKDVENLTSLMRIRYKDKNTNKRYKEMIDRENERIIRYEKLASKSYEEWIRDISIIWKFGDFWKNIEGNERTSFVWGDS